MSPPSRGAWIEICIGRSVDFFWRSRPPRGGRGLKWAGAMPFAHGSGRPPRGGRGLKYTIGVHCNYISAVAPLAGGVD